MPWGGPERVILPGYHTAAENAFKKKNATGNELFLAVCGLMSTGTRTILISRWRAGGQTSFNLVREFAPEAVISDIGLPGDLDGYAVARTLRAYPGGERLYLIALSGYSNEDARRRSREAGFDVHLAKPPDIATLEQALVEAAGQ